MGLSIAVGMLADIKQHDPDALADFKEEFEELNAILEERGLPRHKEPLDVEPWSDPLSIGGFPYSWIHHLRRFQAYHLAGKTAPPLKKGEDPAEDPILDHAAAQNSHLIYHSDCEGYYIPVDFADVIIDDAINGEMLGSSQRLLDELRALAPALGFTPDGDAIPPEQVKSTMALMESQGPLFREKAAWVVLFDAAAASIRHRAAIYFC